MNSTAKIYNVVMQFSVVVFSITLAWFSFIYYPKIVNEYKNVATGGGQPAGQVSANFSNFPIETASYRIEFDKNSQNYYVFVKGTTVGGFVENKNSAELVLKSALSLQTLCNLNIIYVSTEKLILDANLKSSNNCK